MSNGYVPNTITLKATSEEAFLLSRCCKEYLIITRQYEIRTDEFIQKEKATVEMETEDGFRLFVYWRSTSTYSNQLQLCSIFFLLLLEDYSIHSLLLTAALTAFQFTIYDWSVMPWSPMQHKRFTFQTGKNRPPILYGSG